MLVCPRCQRANQEVAIFCYFDGTELRAPLLPSAPAVPADQLAHAFVFPSGRSCQTFDELVEACQEDWAGARALLEQGLFAQFLATVGRADLAQLANEAITLPDPDLALTTFLAGLPSTRPRAPRLELNPRRLLLGALRMGESRQVQLTIKNVGLGLLQGTVTLADGMAGEGEWARLAGGTKGGRQIINTATVQALALHVDTSGLPAGQTYHAKLLVKTNGGGAEVPVRMDVAGMPFPWPPFQGATSPRDLAERMRKQPKAAVEFLESGEIARWFLGNGWHYPIQGTLAQGIGAVQQFFESMGLSRPPVVRVSEPDVRMAPVYPELVRWEVTLFTDVKKWVYGTAESDVPWIKVLTPTLSGPQQAAVIFEVDSSLLEPKRVYAGQVHIHANAGQVLTVHVRADVQESDGSLTRRLFTSFLSSGLALGLGGLGTFELFRVWEQNQGGCI